MSRNSIPAKASRAGKQRVPCSFEVNRDLRTVYATVHNGFKKRVWEYQTRFHEPASLAYAITVFAILVYQGSDPTVPYQALVIRESAMLC
jgi:hypothetical protein